MSVVVSCILSVSDEAFSISHSSAEMKVKREHNQSQHDENKNKNVLYELNVHGTLG